MTEQAEVTEADTSISTGSKLKLARESHGLACEDIARDLKLDLKLIEALESDDVDNLPQPVYTAGYIRNYARLVSLSADSMVADYVKQETKDLPPIAESTRPESLPERYRQVAEALPRSFSIAAVNARNATPVQYAAIAIGVVLAIIIGWQSSLIYDDKAEVERVQAQASNIETDKNVVESENKLSSEPKKATDIAIQQIKSSVAPTKELASPTVDSKPSLAQKSSPPESAPSKSAQKVNKRMMRKEKSESVAEQIEMAETIGISKNDNPVQEMPLSGNKLPLVDELEDNVSYVEKELKLKDLPEDTQEGDALALLRKSGSTDLILTFTRNSWVDIRDATGKRLIRKLGIAGNTQKIRGVAPFQVLLGFGHGVTIEYNGKAVDFSAFQGNTVARFTLEVPKEKEVPAEPIQ